MNLKYLICIPTYNESENIKNILISISCLKLKNVNILIIDDNSPDKTSKIVKKIIRNKTLNNKIFVIDRKNKQGLGKAYITGFKWALKHNYDYILSMDADFSHHPKYLPKMIKKSKNYDVIIGSRYIKEGKIIGWPWFRYLNSWGANIFTRIFLGLKPKDVTSGFKCYNNKFLSSINLDKIVSSGYAFQVEMIKLAQENNFSIIEFPIVFTDRKTGKSKISGELTRSIKSIFSLALQKKSYRQFIKFGIVGATGTIIDLLAYNGLAIFLGFNIYIARSISFILGAINNYILNRVWTFRNKNKQIAKQFSKFIFISFIGLLINLLIMRSLQGLVSPIENEFLRKNIPVFIAIIIVFFWNFFINKYWTFKEDK